MPFDFPRENMIYDNFVVKLESVCEKGAKSKLRIFADRLLAKGKTTKEEIVYFLERGNE